MQNVYSNVLPFIYFQNKATAWCEGDIYYFLFIVIPFLPFIMPYCYLNDHAYIIFIHKNNIFIMNFNTLGEFYFLKKGL